jgi:hypothetical protein
MADSPGKRTVAIVSACMSCDGTPALVLNEVAVSEDEILNGIHYYLAEAQLLNDGYEEPFVHFDQNEAPAFLHAAVRNRLGLTPVPSLAAVHSEES